MRACVCVCECVLFVNFTDTNKDVQAHTLIYSWHRRKPTLNAQTLNGEAVDQ